ncbi:MAG: DUF5721 family protein [Lachnospiraceae bacterium]|nr:DUF5721 family protein [Lachnospiraceae bacterium]
MTERKISQTKEFMQALLTRDVFDRWFLVEAQVVGANTWTVDGHLNHAYFEGDMSEETTPSGEYACWAVQRPIILQLIRGKRTPLSFRFLMMPPDDFARAEVESARTGMDRICRIRFQEGHVFVTSAVSMKEFTLDREPERAWDESLSRFLAEKELAFEEL